MRTIEAEGILLKTGERNGQWITTEVLRLTAVQLNKQYAGTCEFWCDAGTGDLHFRGKIEDPCSVTVHTIAPDCSVSVGVLEGGSEMQGADGVSRTLLEYGEEDDARL